MSFKIGSNSVRGLVLNIGLVLVLLGLMSFVFFYKVMPYVTNQNKVLTVPDLRGMTNKEAVRFLAARQLQYEFGDSLFRADVDPLLVLDQYPKANSKVKIYRKIKLNLNAATPPLVVYPDLKWLYLSICKATIRVIRVEHWKYLLQS